MKQMRFAYEARNSDGELTAGLLTADSLEDAGEQLRTQNLFIVRIAVDEDRQPDVTAKASATRAQIAWNLSQLAVMVETGIGLGESLDILARQASTPQLKSLLQNISESVREGMPLSDAMARHPKAFPSSLIAMVRASEMSGTLSSVLRKSAGYLVNDLKVIKRIKTALLYPAFMLVLCVTITVFLLTVILPRFAEIFSARDALLPLPTRILLGLSNSITTYWHIWIITACIAALLTSMGIRSKLGAAFGDWLTIRVPVISNLFNKLYQSRMFRAMAMLLDSGVPLVDAVAVVQDVVPNRHYRALWAKVDEQIRHGEPFSKPFLSSDLMNESVAQMIAGGDRAGRMGFVFNSLADFIETEYDQAVRAATQFIEPVMILIMGGLIGFIAAAMMIPLFQASQVIAS